MPVTDHSRLCNPSVTASGLCPTRCGTICGTLNVGTPKQRKRICLLPATGRNRYARSRRKNPADKILSGPVCHSGSLHLSCLWTVDACRCARVTSTLRAQNRTAFAEVPILAPRGKIYDREGQLIVDNYPSFSALLLRDQMRDVNADAQKIADGLHLPVAGRARQSPPLSACGQAGLSNPSSLKMTSRPTSARSSNRIATNFLSWKR